VEKGGTFEEYLWRCARAFVSEMRDTPIDAPIPFEVVLDDYYFERYRDNMRELQLLEDMTEQEQYEYGKKLKDESLELLQTACETEDCVEQKYANMFTQVKGWEPPTDDYVNLRNFMLSELNISRTRTIVGQWVQRKKDVVNTTPMEYYSRSVANARERVEDAWRSYQDARDRVEATNAWLETLRIFVPQPKSENTQQ
jgi:hypothetical protein